MRLGMRCPWCGHATMHYGEKANLRGEVRADVFSCRGCGAAYDEQEIREMANDYLAALGLVKEKGVKDTEDDRA